MIRVIQISSKIAGTALPDDILRDLDGPRVHWLISLDTETPTSWGRVSQCLRPSGLGSVIHE